MYTALPLSPRDHVRGNLFVQMEIILMFALFVCVHCTQSFAAKFEAEATGPDDCRADDTRADDYCAYDCDGFGTDTARSTPRSWSTWASRRRTAA